MSKGMHSANQVIDGIVLLCNVMVLIIEGVVVQVLLAGCSAGGLAVILHCDRFRGLFPSSSRVKCLSDGGLFMDA